MGEPHLFGGVFDISCAVHVGVELGVQVWISHSCIAQASFQLTFSQSFRRAQEKGKLVYTVTLEKVVVMYESFAANQNIGNAFLYCHCFWLPARFEANDTIFPNEEVHNRFRAHREWRSSMNRSTESELNAYIAVHRANEKFACYLVMLSCTEQVRNRFF